MGVVGLALNLVTGILFLFGAPSRYLTNPAFQWKVVFLVIAGLNVLIFTVLFSRRTLAVGPDEDTPVRQEWWPWSRWFPGSPSCTSAACFPTSATRSDSRAASAGDSDRTPPWAIIDLGHSR